MPSYTKDLAVAGSYVSLPNYQAKQVRLLNISESVELTVRRGDWTAPLAPKSFVTIPVQVLASEISVKRTDGSGTQVSVRYTYGDVITDAPDVSSGSQTGSDMIAAIDSQLGSTAWRTGGGSGSGIDPDMTEEADLDAITTTDITPGDAGSIVQYIDAEDEQLKTWFLKSSTAASVAGSIRRAGDYNGTTNTKVWFMAAH